MFTDRFGRIFGIGCLVATLTGLGEVVEVPPQTFDAGGWKLDVQFYDTVGSAYLLAHGLGIRVTDAKASVRVAEGGKYRVWVRARNWADGAPGRFRVTVGGKDTGKDFGVSQKEWAWEDGGEVELPSGETEVRLCDMTGFDGRCAGVVLENEGKAPDKLGIGKGETCEVAAEFAVVGGGLPGTCAALAAARRGVKTVIVQDRPMLGGNASEEIRVWSAGETRHELIREVRGLFLNRDANMKLSDARRMRVVEDEPNLKVLTLTRATGAATQNGKITEVKAVDFRKNRMVKIRAKLFCDATGDGWLGYWAGADYRMGREARSEFNEPSAPEKGDGDTLGASLMWTSAEANQKFDFSAPWAEPHAQGETAINGAWNWEYGIHRNMIEEGEAIRDRLLLAIYGAFSRAKKLPENANRMLDFCPYLLGKRESRRLMGDWVYSELDVTERREFEDSIASGSWSIDLHFDDCKEGVDFLTTCRQPHYGRYWIPYRSIYSRNVTNMFMVGRCFSCTHVGLGGTRVMNTLAQLGVAAGEAAALCVRDGMLPRDVYAKGKVRELQERLGGGFPGVPDRESAGWKIVDDETAGVKFGEKWRFDYNCNGDQVGNGSHFPGGNNWATDLTAGSAVGDATYPLPVTKRGKYVLREKVPYQYQAHPGSKTVAELTSGGKTNRIEFDQGIRPGTWQKVGEYNLEPGATLKIIGKESFGMVIADGFALEEVK